MPPLQDAMLKPPSSGLRLGETALDIANRAFDDRITNNAMMTRVRETRAQGSLLYYIEQQPAGADETLIDGIAAGLEKSVDKPRQSGHNVIFASLAIRALKESIRKRSGELKPFLGSGSVGIGHDGMLVALNLDGVPLRDQATLRRLVSAENRDRNILDLLFSSANVLGGYRIPDS